jgi:hypothetical protein
MNLFVLVSVLCSFLTISEGSNNGIDTTTGMKRLAIIVEDKDSHKEYMQFLKERECFDYIDEFIEKTLVKTIKHIYKYGNLVELFKDKEEMFRTFIKTNDPEKFDYLYDKEGAAFGTVFNGPEMILFACRYGSYNLLTKMFRNYYGPDHTILSKSPITPNYRRKFANASSNVETLKWMYSNLNMLPDKKGILALCKNEKMEMIDWIYRTNSELLNDQIFVNQALSDGKWKVVNFFISNFRHLIDMNNRNYLIAPLELFKILESNEKITQRFINIENILFSIEYGGSGFIEWAVEKGFRAKDELLKDQRFKKAIHVAIVQGFLRTLGQVYGKVVANFEIPLHYLQEALRYGKFEVLKFLVQKEMVAEDPPSDDFMISSLEQTRTQYSLFDDFVEEARPDDIVLSGNVTIVKYFQERFPMLNL